MPGDAFWADKYTFQHSILFHWVLRFFFDITVMVHLVDVSVFFCDSSHYKKYVREVLKTLLKAGYMQTGASTYSVSTVSYFLTL